MTQTYVFLCQVGATLRTRPVAILAGVIGVLALLPAGLALSERWRVAMEDQLPPTRPGNSGVLCNNGNAPGPS